ncbi:TonB-dependent siderophore receptor [Pseudothauera rhizosphaerae]|uniref:TonB-dependent siderophore receptor n=1 Tax=Pseudothauera rhizosphaerae TaxID=2565932 RepID=A0A4S4AYT3_9RHOO|nr:TonB-dependent siderophore receptor [Pseudothauera rhizosphaerae]THF65295.1 TonB-dependent siderophore receptor [Pseudothauera rhizosphaerae]
MQYKKASKGESVRRHCALPRLRIVAAMLLMAQAQAGLAQSTDGTDEKADGSAPKLLAPVLVEDEAVGGYVERASVGKVPLTAREIPQSVSVLTRKQMDDQDMVTITEAMRQVTGVNVIANDTVNNQYFVRGYGLGVMYDGVPSYNGMTPSHQLDLAAYERIEVLRGPAGVLRGSGEPGGVVNFVKKRPQDKFGFSWEASAGSWDNYRAAGDVTGPLNQDKTLRGRLVVSNEDRRYFYDHTQSKKWLGLAAFEYDVTPRTTLSLSFVAQDQDVDAPWSGLPASRNPDGNGVYPLLDVPRSTFNAPDWGRMRYQTEETTAGAEHRFDNGWVAKAVVNHRKQNQYYKYAFTSTGVHPVTNLVDYRSFRGDYHYTRDGLDLYASGPFEFLGRTHNFLVGWNTEVYNSKGKFGNGPNFTNIPFGDTSSLIEPTINYASGSESETAQHGLYSQLRLSVADPVTLVLGARTTTFKAKTRNRAPSTPTAWRDGAEADDEITPYGALLFDLNRYVTLYGSYTSIFVPQTQLKADGGTLEPRTGHQYELGSKAEFFDGKLAASLALFNIRDKDRAYADPDRPTDNFYLNAGEIESKGWEAEVSGSPLPGLDLVAGYTRLTTRYLKDRNNQGKDYSIASPKHQFKLWANYRFAPDSDLAGVSVGLGLLAQSKAQSSRGWRDELLNSGYGVVNGRIAYQIDKTYSLSLLVNNLLDRKYYASVGTPSMYNFYGEPRNFLLTLRAQY